VVQRKTGRPVQFEITDHAREAVERWIQMKGLSTGDVLFPSRVNPGRPMSTRQYARRLGSWVRAVGLDSMVYGTHSLRRTNASMIYRRTGNLRAVQLLLGHTKLESTVRYLGIEVDDALTISEQVEISPHELLTERVRSSRESGPATRGCSVPGAVVPSLESLRPMPTRSSPRDCAD